MVLSGKASIVGSRDLTAGTSWLRTVLPGAIFVFLASNYFSIAVNSIALGVIAATWIAIMIAERRFLVVATPLDYFFLAYVVAECLSTVFSKNPLQALIFSKRLLLIGIVYLFASVITSERMAKQCVAVLLGSAVVVAVLGVLKLVFGDPAANTRLGIFQFYMTTSELMMMAALLMLPYIIHPKTPETIRWLAVAGLAPVLVCLYATVTRGAYLAAAAGALFIALVRYKKLLIPLVILFLLVLLFAPPYVESRLRSIVDLNHPENLSRIMLWTAGLRIFVHNPLVGVGDIDLHDLLVQYANPGSVITWGHVHNILLQVLVTLGALGFIAVVSMFVKIFLTEWKIYRVTKEDWFSGSCVLGALAVFVGLQVNGLTEWSYGDQEVVIMFWTTLGIALGISSLTETRAEDHD